MSKEFKVGDSVEWHSSFGIVRGIIKKKITHDMPFHEHTLHASKEEPQYLVESIKTGKEAIHKESALRKVSP